MTNDLELYHNILLIDRPWLSSYTDQKYQQLQQTVSKENYAQQPLYDLSFPKALTAKRKYYHALIDNEARRYINAIHSIVKDASNENERKYWIHNTLTRKLKDQFSEAAKAINKNQFYFSAIDDKNQTQSQKDNAYIVQLLKYELIRIYLEIQDSYSAYIQDEPLTEADLISLYFQNEETPEKSFIIKAPDYKLPKATTSISIQPEKQNLKVIKADIREPLKGVLRYDEIIAKPERFALAESELFQIELIDADYRFIKKHGNVEKMAAVYHIMIQKQYFKPVSFTGGQKKITDLQIRKFLNHRYVANIDKEFRNFKKKKDFDAYISNNSGLSLIIPS